MDYTKQVQYLFEVNGESFAISSLCRGDDGDIFAEVEETRKNGQEDTHMAGIVVFVDGEWQWDENDGPGAFETYLGEDYPQAILDYLRENEHPELKRKKWQSEAAS